MGKTSVETAQSIPPAAGLGPAPKPAGMPYWEPLVRACAQMSPALTEIIQRFWGVPVHLTFFTASTKTHYFWRMDDFHVSQLMLSDAQPEEAQEPPMALLRLSDAACSALLTRVLGPRPSPQRQFSFKQLSPLEATILNDFSKDLLSGFMKGLIKKPAKVRRTETVHLVWTVQLADRGSAPSGDQPLQFMENFEVGKIVLSLPLNAVRIDLPPHADGPPPETVPDTFFYHVETAVRLFLGSTRIPLADLNQLEPEDMVVLENSQADRLYVVDPHGGERIPFGVIIPQQPYISIPYSQELAMMDTSHAPAGAARQNLWDNLMIEVNAEFAPIKLPLKQLKQMSEGLVVEMGDLVNNKICLQVEGKTLAWGELIIVGDKFGVRISQVAPESDTAAPEAAPAAAPAPAAETGALTPMGENSPAPAADEEENLDNFLNDDFDDTFDDEEEW